MLEAQFGGKSDWIVKLIAVVQIIWFDVQLLARVVIERQSTVLEVTTTAYVFCPFSTYDFCWNRPQNVEYPVILEINTVALKGDKPNNGT